MSTPDEYIKYVFMRNIKIREKSFEHYQHLCCVMEKDKNSFILTNYDVFEDKIVPKKDAGLCCNCISGEQIDIIVNALLEVNNIKESYSSECIADVLQMCEGYEDISVGVISKRFIRFKDPKDLLFDYNGIKTNKYLIDFILFYIAKNNDLNYNRDVLKSFVSLTIGADCCLTSKVSDLLDTICTSGIPIEYLFVHTEINSLLSAFVEYVNVFKDRILGDNSEEKDNFNRIILLNIANLYTDYYERISLMI